MEPESLTASCPRFDLSYCRRLNNYLEAKMGLVSVIITVHNLAEENLDETGQALAKLTVSVLIDIYEHPGKPTRSRPDGASALMLEAVPDPEERKRLVTSLREVNAMFTIGRATAGAVDKCIKIVYPLIGSLDAKMSTYTEQAFGRA